MSNEKLIGVKINFLTILSEPKTKIFIQKNGIKRYNRIVSCQCECGRISEYKINAIKSGNTKSCGCFRKKSTGNFSRTHGECRSSYYRIWIAMRDRCNNPNNQDYHHYGGKGIKVCEEWNSSYETFKSDMGEKPDKYTIERIDGSKGYCKDNCKWIPRSEQSKNTSQNIRVIYNGSECKLLDLFHLSEIAPEVIRERIRAGWSVEDALFVPKNTAYHKLGNYKKSKL